MSQSDQQVFRERALKDKAAILELRQSAAFQTYFMRRISNAIATDSEQLIRGVMSKDEREELRQKILHFEEIAKWTSDAEIISCDRIVTG